jgi:propanediol dehydratase large subunit
MTPERQQQVDTIRQQRSVADLLSEQQSFVNKNISELGTAEVSYDPRDVVIGVSPATGKDIWVTLSGLSVADAIGELLAGLEEEGCVGRIVRINDTLDLGMIGLTAARLSGSGVSVGLQAKGTALIHRRDLAPLANLELYSVAPTITRDLYRMMGINAGRHAKGATPQPVRNPYSDEAIEARYHTKVVSLVAIERMCVSSHLPQTLVVT